MVESSNLVQLGFRFVESKSSKNFFDLNALLRFGTVLLLCTTFYCHFLVKIFSFGSRRSFYN